MSAAPDDAHTFRDLKHTSPHGTVMAVSMMKDEALPIFWNGLRITRQWGSPISLSIPMTAPTARSRCCKGWKSLGWDTTARM